MSPLHRQQIRPSCRTTISGAGEADVAALQDLTGEVRCILVNRSSLGALPTRRAGQRWTRISGRALRLSIKLVVRSRQFRGVDAADNPPRLITASLCRSRDARTSGLYRILTLWDVSCNCWGRPTYVASVISHAWAVLLLLAPRADDYQNRSMLVSAGGCRYQMI